MTSGGFRDNVRATMINTALLGLKMFLSNVYKDKQQTTKDDASDEAKEAQDRAQRIVNNDLENIPVAIGIAWGVSFCIFLKFVTDIFDEDYEDERSDSNTLGVSLIVGFSIFTFARYCHTAFYMFGLALPRTIAYLLGVLMMVGVTIVGLIAAWSINKMTFLFPQV